MRQWGFLPNGEETALPTERLSMCKIQEVLRPRYALGLGQRQIGRTCSIAQATVHEYLKRAQRPGSPGRCPKIGMMPGWSKPDLHFTCASYLDNHMERSIWFSRKRPVQGVTKEESTTNTDVIRGTLDMLILKTLGLEPRHGFGIARRVEQISRGVFKVNPGSLLTALQRLERAGWLDSEWRQTANSRRAKFYKLSRAGRKQLEFETADWTRRASAIARLLKAEGQ
jgi:PadR family transcriptional regulator, regulatory protein PadR